jgi:hypothetical protein
MNVTRKKSGKRSFGLVWFYLVKLGIRLIFEWDKPLISVEACEVLPCPPFVRRVAAFVRHMSTIRPPFDPHSFDLFASWISSIHLLESVYDLMTSSLADLSILK